MNKIESIRNKCTVEQILEYYEDCDKYNEEPSLPCYVENGVIYIQYED